MTALIVLGCILLAVLLLLCAPVRLRITATNSEIHAKISLMKLIQKRLYPHSPSKKKKKSVRKSKAEPKAESSAPKKKATGSLQQLRELRSLVAAILIRMPQTFSLKIRRLYVSVATGDPARTALLYGTVSSSLSFLLEWLDRHLFAIRPIRAGCITVKADFEGEETETSLDVTLSTTLLRLLSLGAKVLLPHFLRRKRKNKNHHHTKKGTIPCQK